MVRPWMMDVDRVREFAATAPFRVRMEHNPTRLGATANFERAASPCRGDIVFLADQDDIWLPDKIAVLAAHLDAEPDAGAVFCNGRVVDIAVNRRVTSVNFNDVMQQ